VWEGYRYSAADQAATLAAAHALARTYAAAPSGWLYLVGPVGAGKSSLMAALLNALAETHELIGLYGVAADLLDYIRAGYARDADVRAEQRAAQLREAPLLCLDDLGAEQTTDWSEAALFGILNARWQHNRPTIITSNVPLSALSPRIQSRIAGMSAGPRPEIPVIAADARAYLRARGNR
jgi:DNA replication protein DnaC